MRHLRPIPATSSSTSSLPVAAVGAAGLAGLVAAVYRIYQLPNRPVPIDRLANNTAPAPAAPPSALLTQKRDAAAPSAPPLSPKLDAAETSAVVEPSAPPMGADGAAGELPSYASHLPHPAAVVTQYDGMPDQPVDAEV